MKIDKILDDSFKGDYYFNFAKEMFPDTEQLRRLEIWAGEPTLRLDRAYHTVEKLIEYYPRLDTFFMSTNFTGDNWKEQFFGLIEILKRYSKRQFTFLLQLSLDGPKKINDAQRGVGVTNRFREHFIKYIAKVNDELKGFPNIKIVAHFKPTLTNTIIHELIQDKQNIIDYYAFFESFKTYFEQNINVKNAELQLTVPNTAVPAPNTKEDGLVFAKFCGMCKEIMEENRISKKHFSYYTDIMPFKPRYKPDYTKVSYCQTCGACGSGKSVVGLLPYDYISCCHNGFVNLISEYKQKCVEHKDETLDFKFFMNDSNSMIRTKKDFIEYEKSVDFAYNAGSSVKLANIASLILALANVGQVSEKYKSPQEALKGALFIQAATAYCFRDNIGVTGSVALVPVGLIKLLLNGAREVIESVNF